MVRLILLTIILFPKVLLSQSDFDGFIICVDNSGDGDKNMNQYYYIPLDFSKNKELFSKESLEDKDDELEFKVKEAGGLKIFKEIFFSEPMQEITFEKYSNLTLKLFYFHYIDDSELFPKINKNYFLKKINHNNYYAARIHFKAYKKIDRTYLKSIIDKLFVCEIAEIKEIDEIERNKLTKFIEDAYLK